jgi:hypothetical protein
MHCTINIRSIVRSLIRSAGLVTGDSGVPSSVIVEASFTLHPPPDPLIGDLSYKFLPKSAVSCRSFCQAQEKVAQGIEAIL